MIGTSAMKGLNRECFQLKINVDLFLLQWIRQNSKCFYLFCGEDVVGDRNVTKSVESQDFGLETLFKRK